MISMTSKMQFSASHEVITGNTLSTIGIFFFRLATFHFCGLYLKDYETFSLNNLHRISKTCKLVNGIRLISFLVPVTPAQCKQ